MKPIEAIRAATIDAAELLGMSKQVGRLEAELLCRRYRGRGQSAEERRDHSARYGS